ncbi:hypothetical protein [Tenacibaculum sp. SG-28]|uniref:hypothetical protein n=1 Tax=Tenacibaculum sp. SG-28 TaxID=754426 RepID=UPI000CF3B153|nr:hypothetical protein [Tenacibaculum sp. SG-28]PQJ23324.1 hypothetical protein BSU00_03765 [Tenacibaculum sp. SG-28]
MKEDNIDSIIREALATREIKPSNSSWDRIAVQLEEKKKVKVTRTKLQYYAAASILVLAGLSIYFYTLNIHRVPSKIAETTISKKDTSDVTIEKEIIVKPSKTEPVKSIALANKSNIIPKTILEETLPSNLPTENLASSSIKPNKEVIPTPIETLETKENKNSIQVDPKALLFAVTHDREEVMAYYTAHKLNREVLMDSIRVELDKANLTISPELILAAVENDILQETLEGNFMHTVKLKISDIAIAIAERNK